MPEFDPLFHHFPVLARTLLWYLPGAFPILGRSFFGTCPKPSPVLARTLLQYSPGAFSVLARTLLRYLPGTFSGTRLDPSPVLARILPIFGTRPDSTIFRYLPEPFSGTCHNQIPNLSRHRDRVSFYLSPASYLYPIVHSVSMTYFP